MYTVFFQYIYMASPHRLWPRQYNIEIEKNTKLFFHLLLNLFLII